MGRPRLPGTGGRRLVQGGVGQFPCDGHSARRSAKVSSYGYTPRGQVKAETKPNGNIVSYDYHLDGLLASQVEKTAGGGLVEQHLLEYWIRCPRRGCRGGVPATAPAAGAGHLPSRAWADVTAAVDVQLGSG